MSSYGERYEQYYKAVETALPDYLPQGETLQKTVQEAMAYSLLGGGKRIRAVLCLAGGRGLALRLRPGDGPRLFPYP